MSSISDTRTGTVPRPTSGSFYVIAVVDDANVVAEANENNNLAASAAPLTSGVDLVAQDVSGPSLGGPGDALPVQVSFSNQGIEPAGTVAVKVWLSLDSVLGAGDLLVHSSNVAVAGGQNVATTVTANLPNNINQGEYAYILSLDDGPNPGVIVEASENNNVRVSAGRVSARQADLIVDEVTVLEPVAPFAPAKYTFFAEQVRLQAKVRNIGGATVSNFTMLFFGLRSST